MSLFSDVGNLRVVDVSYFSWLYFREEASHSNQSCDVFRWKIDSWIYKLSNTGFRFGFWIFRTRDLVDFALVENGQRRANFDAVSEDEGCDWKISTRDADDVLDSAWDDTNFYKWLFYWLVFFEALILSTIIWFRGNTIPNNTSLWAGSHRHCHRLFDPSSMPFE